MGYYDMQGKPITAAEWSAQFESIQRVVAKTEVGGRRVSTVWMGIDHGFGERPVIFETMVFEGDEVADVGELAQCRYSTLAEAEAGHAATVARLEQLPPNEIRLPKFIGQKIPGATEIGNDFNGGPGWVVLSYSQAILLPPSEIYCSLDTSDKGSRGSLAKRWFRWFARPESIIACRASTMKMLEKANVVGPLVALLLMEATPEARAVLLDAMHETA